MILPFHPNRRDYPRNKLSSFARKVVGLILSIKSDQKYFLAVGEIEIKYTIAPSLPFSSIWIFDSKLPYSTKSKSPPRESSFLEKISVW
jgi:hypothetical protein